MVRVEIKSPRVWELQVLGFDPARRGEDRKQHCSHGVAVEPSLSSVPQDQQEGRAKGSPIPAGTPSASLAPSLGCRQCACGVQALVPV